MRRLTVARVTAFMGVLTVWLTVEAPALSHGVEQARRGPVAEHARAPAAAQASVAVQPEVRQLLAERGRADVLVLLRDGVTDDRPGHVLSAAAGAAQGSVLARLEGTDFALRTQYDVLPLLAGTVGRTGLEALARHPLVVAVEVDEVMRPAGVYAPAAAGARGRSPALAEALPVIGVDYVHRELGLRGNGVAVAVLDTGIDNDHPDFAGRIVDQYCYSSSRSCAPSNIPEGPNAQDEAGHGTAVAGIVLSAGAQSPLGVAPEASLVAVRVFRDAGGAQTSDIIKGLDFVLRRQPQTGTRVVNMSLGAGSGRGVNCDSQNQSMKEAFQRLVNRRVAIFVATGNDGLTNAVAAPACISNSTAVGATYDGDYPTGGGFCPGQRNVTPLTIACFTNRGRAMDILAPGLFITTSALGGGVTRPGAGTSYASPMAAGVAALMLQANPSLRPADVERYMIQTGVRVQHLENNDTFPLVDAKAAVLAALGATPDAGTGTPPTQVPSPTPSPSATVVVDVTPTASPEPTASATPSPDAPAPLTDVPPAPTALPTRTPARPLPAGWVLHLPALARSAGGG